MHLIIRRCPYVISSVVLVGDATVGKTHLLSRYIKGTLPRAPTATIGVEFATRTVPLAVGGTVKAQIWDTAGQERYRAITSAHYRRAVGALLVYDVTRRNTFLNCSKWMEELRQNAEPDIVILLVGNKIDLVEKDPSTRQVTTEEATAFAKENGLFFAEASAVSSVNVKFIFEKLLQEIYNQRSRAQAEGTSPRKCPSPSHIARVPEYAPAQAPPHGRVETTTSSYPRAMHAETVGVTGMDLPPPPLNAPVSLPRNFHYHHSVGGVPQLPVLTSSHAARVAAGGLPPFLRSFSDISETASHGSSTSNYARSSGSSPVRRRSGSGGHLHVPLSMPVGDTRSYSGSKVDTSSVPRPTGPSEPVGRRGGRRFETGRTGLPPSACSVYTAIDKGNASCRFLRSTTYTVPAQQSTAHSSGISLGIIAQPFAELSNDERDVPLINYGEAGPMRCPRCRAYANPAFQWIGGGEECICNFCNYVMEVPQIHQYPVPNMRERPELEFGSVDYVAPSDYLRPDGSSTERPPGFCFVVDCGYCSVASGMFHQVIASIRTLLSYMPSLTEVCFIFFDDVIHFYRLNSAEVAEEIVVADVDDPFLPIHSSALFVNPHSSEEAIQALLDLVIREVESTKRPSASCGLAALKVATEGLAMHGGGCVMMFYGTYPDIGIGSLRPSQGSTEASGESPECRKSQLQPRNPELWSRLLAKCLSKAVSVDTFIAVPPSSVDNKDARLPTLCYLTANTGGNIHIYRSFSVEDDGEALHFDVARAVTKAAAYGCVVQARASRGLSIDRYLGRWSQTAPRQPAVPDPRGGFLLPKLDCDAVFGFSLYLDEGLQARYAYFQLAVLHHNAEGIRLLRVHTLRLSVSTSLSAAYRSPDVETLTNLLARQAAEDMLLTGHSPREKLLGQCSTVLHAYRVNCASSSAPKHTGTQLLLPETLKLMPLYIGGLLKLPAFRPAADVSIDERYECLMSLLGYSVSQSTHRVYPRVYSLHDMPSVCGTPTEIEDNIFLPRTVAASAEQAHIGKWDLPR
ncbi:Protein transport protein Sec24D [Perkinsus olseni]|uniref:Protein transport protein Sec24D n=1 Tax=Perkinsus olseni TaxID=32597 RepID=A0A7J6PXC5_PEROL|nr:Protein transport protein Sec24D [Perkinsus olseni]